MSSYQLKIVNFIQYQQLWFASKVMDLEAARAQNGPKWALVLTGVLALFLLTGILLVASLNTEGVIHADASTTSAISTGQTPVATERSKF